MSIALKALDYTKYRDARPVLSFDQAKDLAAQHGTPLLVLSRSVLLDNHRQMRDGLPGVELFYAAKANPSHAILKTLREAGCSVDVCSPGEMRQALAAGFSTDDMIHTHPCKTIENLSTCYEAGITWFTFDGQPEIPKLVRYAPKAKLLLRLAVSSKSSVINLSSKYGATPSKAQPVLEKARAAGLDVRGISFHVGSQCISPDDYAFALREARGVYDTAVARGFDLEVVDIGGGFPVPYRTPVLKLEEFARVACGAIQDIFGDAPVRIIAEPGRCMNANAVTLVTSVIGKSTRNGTPWYIIDDGLYGSFSGKVYDHADYPILAENHATRPCRPCVVAGPTCDSSDVVARDQCLPTLQIGEILLVPSMGAYTSASASPFNGLELAKMIEID